MKYRNLSAVAIIRRDGMILPDNQNTVAISRQTVTTILGRSLMSTTNVALSIALAVAIGAPAGAQDTNPLLRELDSLTAQLRDVDTTISNLDGGFILSLAQARREALLLLQTVLETRVHAEAAGAEIELTIPAIVPDPERAEQLLGELAAAQMRIDDAAADATAGGGLIQAMARSRLETEKLTLAQLQMAWLQAEYGIAFPNMLQAQTDFSTKPVPDASLGSIPPDLDDAALAWADLDYPEIDYSLAPFETAHRDGHRISGWWVIQSEQAAIDDSPKITAFNYSAYDSRTFGRPTALVVRCHEGETAVIYVQDDFLMSDSRRNTLDVTYRLDAAPAVQTRWNSLTTNHGVGQFRREGEDFVRAMYDAQALFIRVTDNRGRRVDSTFELAGGQIAYDEVAAACGFSTISLSAADYRAIQTMLNAGGFDAGTPDGLWGAGSQRAMRRFQAENGLPETGAPDRQTLETLGVGE